jgi:hypothetical protein
MAKLNSMFVLIFLFFITCRNNNYEAFKENKISISIRLSNGIQYFFPDNIIQNLNISQKKDTIELTITEFNDIIELYYASNLDGFIGEKAVVGNHNIFPREVDNILIYKNKNKKASIVILNNNQNGYYGNDHSEVRIFEFRDKILEVLKKKKKYLELENKTIYELSKLKIKEKIVM